MATSGVVNIDGQGHIVNLQLPRSVDNVTNLVEDIRNIRSSCFALIHEDFLETLSDEELADVFQALMACATLEMMKISNMSDRSFRAQCHALVRGQLPRLTNFWSVGLTLREPGSSALLIPFVESLSLLPRLEKVHLLMIAPDGDVLSSVTAEFRCRGYDSEGTLWTVDLYDEQISLIRDVFRLNKDRFSNLKLFGTDASGAATQTLGVLLLMEATDSALDNVLVSCDLMHRDGANHIANAVSRNACLKELTILIAQDHSTSYPIEPLADMLRTNTSLEWLILSRSLLDDRCAVAFAAALKHNQTLKVWDVDFSTPGEVRITDKGFQALLEMLYVNKSMEIIPTHGIDDEALRQRIEWYLNLNESGLRQIDLSVNTSHDEFLNILQEQDELDYIFYLLSQNTALLRGNA